MENSEVLNQPTTEVPKDAPEQKDVAPIEGAPAVLEQNTSNIYAQAKRVTQPVGEKDHASEIAMNNEEARKTYDYNSQGAKVYDESVTTTTTQSTGKEPLSAEWNAQYKMGKEYTVDDSQDYSWNKLAAEMSQNTYDQEAAQYRAESIAAKQQIDAAAASAWNNYFASEYSARQTQDKMGWSGGQKQASDLQVQFLQAETAANMYTQDEMQRYGVESKLSIARMYADANQKALALQYYQDEMDLAVQEANRTGWYVSPEAKEMFIQEDLANKILSNPNSTEAEKERAQNVINNCNAYYRNQGYEEGYAYKTDGEGNFVLDERGNKIVVTEFFGKKTLQTLQHEETVRNNKINEELTKQANEIAQQNANTAWLNYQVAEKQYELDLERQNYIEMNKIIESTPYDSKDNNNYWIDNEGEKHKIDKGAEGVLRKSGGKWYYYDPKVVSEPMETEGIG